MTAHPSPILSLDDYITIPTEAKDAFAKLRDRVNLAAPAMIGATPRRAAHITIKRLQEIEELARVTRREIRRGLA